MLARLGARSRARLDEGLGDGLAAGVPDGDGETVGDTVLVAVLATVAVGGRDVASSAVAARVGVDAARSAEPGLHAKATAVKTASKPTMPPSTARIRTCVPVTAVSEPVLSTLNHIGASVAAT